MKLPSGRQIDYGITTGGPIGSVTGALNSVPMTCASGVSYAAHGAGTVIGAIPPRGAGGRAPRPLRRFRRTFHGNPIQALGVQAVQHVV